METPACLAGRLRQRLHRETDAVVSDGRPEAEFHIRRNLQNPAFEEYISDPAKPVPYRARPIDAES